MLYNMATINIADYKRPGIFINEIDDSVRQVPAQNQLINLVAGFSKKGPVNKPILITTPQQFLQIFGDIDRNLEKKSSYFHRTILNILSNSPVWALNLLSTDDTLDIIDYKTISIASNVQNSIVKKAPYSSFYNKSDFWDRDTEAFLTTANSNLDDSRQIMHITNLSDKKVSVFIFKSSANGFNETLDVFYGGANNVPPYLDPKDQAKDYLVSMIIVKGDFSDYATLSVDSKYSSYFNTKGLIKNQINNFINDSTVEVLKNYSALSIIPYFKDVNKNDVFIETIVNNDTDITGVFMAFDIDKVESADYRTGLLDLIGSNLVDDKESAIDYLSYGESILESIDYKISLLDRQGNAFGKNLKYETKYYGSPNFTDGLIEGTGLTEVSLSGLTSYNLNGLSVDLSTTSNTVDVLNVNIGKIRKDTIYLDENGSVGLIQGAEVSNQTAWESVPLKPIPSGTLPIGIASVGTQGSNGILSIDSIYTIPNLTWNGTNGDVNITYSGQNQVLFTFRDTKNSDKDTNYRKTILNKLFSDLQSNFKGGLSVIKDASGNYITVTNYSFVNDGSQDNSLTINVSPSINLVVGDNEIYYINDSLNFIPSGGTIALGLRTNPIASTSGSGFGIASIYSTIYKDYNNGIINSGDYFYPNLFSYKFKKIDFYKSAGNNYITLWYNSGDDVIPTRLSNRKIKLFGSQSNNNIFTILNTPVALSGQVGNYNTKIDLIVNENVITESVATSNGTVTVCGASDSDIRYLKMYMIGSDLYVDYTQDATLLGGNSGINSTDYDLTDIKVISDTSDYKESLEIESVLSSNQIVVDGTRYSSVKIGDYIQAYVDITTLQLGEVPRRLTRVISKTSYPSDPTKSIIKTDSAIDIISFGTDKQTFKYTTMEDYVNTYKAITLGGFKIRLESQPDGTEERQSAILDLIAPNTPISNGLINRNKLSWRYFVDCWGLGLTSNSKQQMVDLCGNKLTALGILSMPSVKSFKKSTSPSFIDKTTKTINTAFIASGGDASSNPSFLYSFGQGRGQSNVAYFFPYVTITDNSRPLLVPPASFVTNTFMNKHTSRLASIKPWTIAAGITNGLVSGIGNVEMDFTPTDIENLNGMNANPIVYKMNRGFCIETDNTAQVSPRSSLSYTHSREVLISLENEMYEMLLTYQWRFNTASVRAEIKTNADRICERYVRDNGLYAFETVMDETNNTSDIIDAQIGILDIFLEISKGLAIIVNNITVLKTGTLASSGFTPTA